MKLMLSLSLVYTTVWSISITTRDRYGELVSSQDILRLSHRILFHDLFYSFSSAISIR